MQEWFVWAFIIFVVIGGVGYQIEKATEEGFEWDVAWHVLKKILSVLLSMILLPLVLIFGRTKERK